MTAAKQPNLDRFKEIALYVAKRSRDDEKFGRTKLNKILFFSDVLSYRRRRSAITGARFVKDTHGPVVDGLVETIDASMKGEAAWESTVYEGLPQKRLIALREPDLSLFSADEISIVDWVIDSLRQHTGKKASKLSHDYPGWRFAFKGEEIPLFSALLGRPRNPTDSEVEYAQQLAERYGRGSGANTSSVHS